MEYALIALVVLSVLAVIGIFVLIMTVGGKPPAEAIAALGRRLEAIANALEGKLTDARTDFAARLTNVKGELRQEVADRLSNGFAEFRSAVEKQLSEGRTEQATTLKLEIAALTSQTSTSLDGIRSVVDSKLGVIGEQVQQKLDQNIKEGFAQFEKVQQHLAEAEKQLRNVGEIGASINDLNNLLKLPHLRGRFGEESLERLLADFLPAQMYELQAAPATGVAGRADAVIKFPDRNLPIDAKFPREQVQALFEGSDPVALEAARIDFVRVMKEQARRIAGYIHPESGTTDMALMYLPSETLYMEAVRSGEITEHLNKLQVFAVSPNTLIVTLKSIQMVFKMYEFAKGYEKATAELGKAQKSFGFFERHFDEIGKSLNKAQDAYGTAKRHLNTYARRVTDLTGQEVPQLGAAADTDDDPAA